MPVATSLSSDEIHQLQTAIDALREELKEEKKHQQFHSSWTRTITITLITYVTLGIYMTILGVKYPYYSAVIPATGFYLSTLSLSPIRNVWRKWCDKRSDALPQDTVLLDVANPI